MMTNLRSSIVLSWHVPLHMLSILGLVCGLVAFAPRPVAAYDWCSEDPIFTFRHNGLLTTHEIDVQVKVPLSALPLSGPSILTVTIPADVTYHEVLQTSVPGFAIQTVFVAGPAHPGNPYPITFAALVPGSNPTVAVQLVITDAKTLKVTTVNGFEGTSVRATIQVGP